ncbi:MAG TPA: D-alanine--D-alanine ligase [Phycisphaerae bacterium]|nr:D-alanine--D-alanine ligase [Phycisphaerae bacterium]
MVLTTSTRFDASRMVLPTVREKLALTVLSGGPSHERAISLQSGQSVAEALRGLGHDVVVADASPTDFKGLARQVDCVFVALHGQFGEDGEVQKVLERRGLAYCGSGPEACATAMNKYLSKRKFMELGLPTPRYSVATKSEISIREAMAAWTLPVVVKPIKEGSSLNCHIVREYGQFRPAIESVLAAYGDCIIEEYIPGKEITVGILGDKVLPPIEIRTKREFYDYDAKYNDSDTQYLFDIDLPADLLGRIEEMSLKAHEGLGCRDFSRVDWRVDPETGEGYILEVNVIPGMTSHSLVPKAAAKAGLAMPALCQYIVDSAIKRKFARP